MKYVVLNLYLVYIPLKYKRFLKRFISVGCVHTEDLVYYRVLTDVRVTMCVRLDYNNFIYDLCSTRLIDFF